MDFLQRMAISQSEKNEQFSIHIEPLDLLPQLAASDCLTTDQCEVVRNSVDRNGRRRLLWHYLQRRHGAWEKLQQALDANNQNSLKEQLEKAMQRIDTGESLVDEELNLPPYPESVDEIVFREREKELIAAIKYLQRAHRYSGSQQSQMTNDCQNSKISRRQI